MYDEKLYPTAVDYGRDMRDTLSRLYDCDFDIGKDSCGGKPDRQKIAIRLLWFGKTIFPYEAEKVISNNGFRPATLKEILAFGARYFDEQIRAPIIALGSLFEKTTEGLIQKGYPFVWENKSVRVVRLLNYGVRIPPVFRFGVVMSGPQRSNA